MPELCNGGFQLKNSRSLTISDEGRVFELDYDGLLGCHDGSALAGVTTGFRVMQAAADALTQSNKPLERQHRRLG